MPTMKDLEADLEAAQAEYRAVEAAHPVHDAASAGWSWNVDYATPS